MPIIRGDDIFDANTGCASAIDARALLSNVIALDRETDWEGIQEQEYAIAANPRPKAIEVFQAMIHGKTVPLIEAKALGLKPGDMLGSSAKLAASEPYGWYTPGLYLASGTVAGTGEDYCVFASDGCRENCLFVSGQRAIKMVAGSQTALAVADILRHGGKLSDAVNLSLLKTWLYAYNKKQFAEYLYKDIENKRKTAKKNGLAYAVRLNATSDIMWESEKYFDVMGDHPDVPFYDYTKAPRRAIWYAQSAAPAFFDEQSRRTRIKAQNPGWPSNYHLVFSYSEINMAWCLIMLRLGVNVTVPFDGTLGKERWSFNEKKIKPILPTRFLGRPVIDGDAYDMRFVDNLYWRKVTGEPPPYVVGLRMKGNYQRAHQNAFFFPAKEAQEIGSNLDYIAEQVYHNTKEGVRQRRAAQMPGNADLEIIEPKLAQAFLAAKQGR